MSGFLNNLHDHHEQRRERREDRREERYEQHDRRGRHDDHDDYDSYGSRDRGQRDSRTYPGQDERRHPGAYEAPSFPGSGRGPAFASGGPPSGRGISQRGGGGGSFDRGDFASDVDIDRMITSGEFDERRGQGRGGRGNESEYGYGRGEERGNAYGRYDAPSGPPERGYGERASEYGRYDAPSGPPPGQGYGERASEHGRYDAPSGPPTGRGYQSQQAQQHGHGAGGAYGGSDRQSQYGSQQTQDRPRYDAPQGPPSGYGRGQGNTPSGAFAASRDGEERYGSGYGGAPNVRNEPPRRGEAASYYDQQGASGKGDRYAHLAGVAQEHGDDDPELYRRATQGLEERIQSQAKSRRPKKGGDDDDEDYRAHVNAHQKAYGGDDHGPLDADTIGAAAAMEAFKQTAALGGSSNAPAGAFKVGGGGSSSKPGRPGREEEEEEDTAATRAGGSGGIQDKLMALAMSQAGKLFDKKNAGSSASGGSEGKTQAMQSAAATAMELFTQYQSKGKLESGDMSKVMGLAMKLL